MIREKFSVPAPVEVSAATALMGFFMQSPLEAFDINSSNMEEKWNFSIRIFIRLSNFITRRNERQRRPQTAITSGALVTQNGRQITHIFYGSNWTFFCVMQWGHNNVSHFTRAHDSSLSIDIDVVLIHVADLRVGRTNVNTLERNFRTFQLSKPVARRQRIPNKIVIFMSSQCA